MTAAIPSAINELFILFSYLSSSEIRISAALWTALLSLRCAITQPYFLL
jgi:hypothetical protein